jgi:hypothetical protein
VLNQYDSLPKEVKKQILDDDNYDHYGKLGVAYDQDTLIEKPTGDAEKAYELWL